MSAMWGWLLLAIASEVAATLSLRASEGFTRLLPSLVVVAGYVVAFYGLSQALTRGMQLGTAYAVWSGVGVAAIAVLGVVILRESLSLVQVAGLVFVVVGVVLLELGAHHA
ncbi:multidrug efflux SMR transporter [Pimelobacter simplex]|uniref:Multidrug efflux SMR transporter n=1 Tax=Nocardioides simplex TaxID=2045 RepID=A0A7J5DTL0_NOCSI|nr:multidrug efflux SMR transporter [Pimelobacter simplex]